MADTFPPAAVVILLGADKFAAHLYPRRPPVARPPAVTSSMTARPQISALQVAMLAIMLRGNLTLMKNY